MGARRWWGSGPSARAACSRSRSCRSAVPVKLTVAHYLTPEGRAIDKVGLTPDVVVEMEHGLITDRERDVQLQKALEILRDEL